MNIKWLLVLFMLVNTYAFEAKILSVNKNVAVINKTVKKGLSGIVLCPYGKSEIICANAVAVGNRIILQNYDSLKNDAFALPVVTPHRGDRVIFGKDYNRILIIAPNQTEYLKVKNEFKNDTVISSDNFAAFISKLPDKAAFVNFAKKLNIGKIVFVLDKVYEVDAKTFYLIKKYGANKSKYSKIFFCTYPDFDLKYKNIESYYKNMIKE